MMIEKRGNEILAADLVIRDSRAPRSQWLQMARSLMLDTATIIQFRSVILSEESTALVSVKAVSPEYPLRGRLVIQRSSGSATEHGPKAGEVFIDPGLLSRLQVKLGDNIDLGDLSLKVTAVIETEPDRGASFVSFAPRLIMNRDDALVSGIISAGSVVSYRLLLAGKDDNIKRYLGWLKKEFPNTDIRSLENASPRIISAIRRAESYLGLAALVGIMLAGVSISRAVAHYCRRHRLNVALFRCFGASNGRIILMFLLQLFVIALIGSLLGVMLGYGLQESVSLVIGNVSSSQLPPASMGPALGGFVLGISSVTGFSLPYVLSLKNVPAIDVLRLDSTPVSPSQAAIYTVFFLLFFLLLIYLTRDIGLLLLVSVVSGIALLIFGGLSYFIIRLIHQKPVFNFHIWRLAVANLNEDIRSGTGDRIAIAIALLALLLITVVKDDLITLWAKRIPPQAPNHFLININQGQIRDINELLMSRGLAEVKFQPLVRARLVAINGTNIESANYNQHTAKHRLQRASNLTWRKTLRPDNEISVGAAWNSSHFGTALLSVENNYAKSLGLTIGDTMTFNFAGKNITFSIFNLRQINWDSFQPNFFLVAPPGILQGFASTYVGSLYVKPQHTATMSELVRQFPNITDINVTAIIKQLTRIINHLASTLQYIFMFILIVTAIVIFSTIYTSRLRRQKQLALLRVFGASDHQMNMALLLEFALQGFLAGTMASIGAAITKYYVMEFILNIPFQLNLTVWLLGPLLGTLSVVVFGLISFYTTTRVSPPAVTVRALNVICISKKKKRKMLISNHNPEPLSSLRIQINSTNNYSQAIQGPLRIAFILLLLLLGACASNGKLVDMEKDNDPFERFNRKIYIFNDKFDQHIAAPIARGYVKVLPTKVRRGVRNFFGNLFEPTTIINDLLQGKISRALEDTSRFVFNSTFGLLGIFDVASHFGLEKHKEDFGQTFARWGFAEGPYLVLPFLGPATIRDGAGLVPYYVWTDPAQYVGNADSRLAYWTLNLLSKRADLLGGSSVLELQLDPYIFLRESYRQVRLNQIYDGDPPWEDDF